MSIFERRVEYTPEHMAQLGRQAGEILDRDVLYLAMEEAEINFLENIKQSLTAGEREAAYMKIHALKGVIKELRRIQSDGVLAEEVIRIRNQ